MNNELAFQLFMAWCGQPPDSHRQQFEAACRQRWNDERDHHSRVCWERVADKALDWLDPGPPEDYD